MEYTVTYEETLARTLIVEADSFSDAHDKMMNAVECGAIVLDAEDYVDSSGSIPFIDFATKCDEDFYRNLSEFID